MSEPQHPIEPEQELPSEGDPRALVHEREAAGDALHDAAAAVAPDVVVVVEEVPVAVPVIVPVAVPAYEGAVVEPLQPGFAPELAPLRAPVRHPHLGDFSIFMVLLLMGFLVTVCVMALVYFTHMLGAMTLQQLQGDTRILLGLEFMIYAVSLGAAIPVFSIAWRRNFFAGVQWHGATAGRFWIRLIGVALAGNIIAGVANLTLPFPKNAPIDQLFKTPMQAWLLFAFGVTVAPFFEEMIFRGFLLPALATAWDWCGEKISGSAPKLYDVTQDPPWSLGAKIFGSILASLPFALMHAAQVSNAWGPLSVLFTVSLILCAVRLKTRSLAASTLVHVTYNFTLFAAMLVQTGGFRHLDKM